MHTKFIQPAFDHKPHLHILKAFIIFANLLSLFMYTLLHIIFYDMPFVLQDELLIALNLGVWATAIAVATSFILFAGDALVYFIRHRKHFKFHHRVHVKELLANTNSGL